VSAAQLYVLRQLDRSASGSLSELARRTLTDRSSVSDVVERLESCTAVLVLDGGHPVGVLTRSDVLTFLADRAPS
jgi:predicted transcriptional regulator